VGEQLAMIKEVFELFDTDGQQQLDEEELSLAIYTLGFSQTSHVQVVCLYHK
jgi:Ca2+-binding EF-hand superfamily protein